MAYTLKQRLLDRCREMEIPLVGIAGVNRWGGPPFQPWMTRDFFPHSIVPGAQSVVVIGLPVELPVLETSPSIYYREMYNVLNSLLDQYTYRLAEFRGAGGAAPDHRTRTLRRAVLRGARSTGPAEFLRLGPGDRARMAVRPFLFDTPLDAAAVAATVLLRPVARWRRRRPAGRRSRGNRARC